MKPLWAVIATAIALAGCRSSQPATNPFLRTTVPPPGTQGMMVMPGEAYPATTPPVVTTPDMGAPAAVTPVVPVTPGQQAPLIAPPPAGPKKEKFQPPGGSYLYHQSSNEPPQVERAGDGVELAAAAAGGAVRQAVYVDERDDETASADGAALRFRGSEGESLGDPPEKLAALAAGPAQAESRVRIVPGSPAAEPAAQGAVGGTSGALRMTAEDSPVRASLGDASAESIEMPAARTAAVPGTQTASGGTTRFVVSETPADTNTIVQSPASPAYSHAADYGTLQGRLEYSQSRRQWKLRYIPIDGPSDAYGGSVVLADSAALSAFKPGDMVAVRGALAAGGAEPGSFAPRYEVASISPLAR